MNKPLIVIALIIFENQFFASARRITVERMREAVTRRLNSSSSDPRYRNEIETELVSEINKFEELYNSILSLPAEKIKREDLTKILNCSSSDNKYLEEIENELVSVINRNYELVQEKNRIERQKDILRIGIFTILIAICTGVAEYFVFSSKQSTVSDFKSRLSKKEY